MGQRAELHTRGTRSLRESPFGRVGERTHAEPGRTASRICQTPRFAPWEPGLSQEGSARLQSPLGVTGAAWEVAVAMCE